MVPQSCVTASARNRNPVSHSDISEGKLGRPSRSFAPHAPPVKDGRATVAASSQWGLSGPGRASLIVVTVSEPRYLALGRCVISGDEPASGVKCARAPRTTAQHVPIVFKQTHTHTQTLLIYFFVNKTNYCTQLYIYIVI